MSPTTLVFIILLTKCLEGLPVIKSGHCTEPNDYILQSEFDKINNGLDIKTLFLESYHADVNASVQFELILRMNQFESSSENCDHKTRGGNLPLKQRALCPWTIAESDTDNGTFPRKLYWAKPRCKNCKGLDSSFGCERIHVRIYVLKRSTNCNDKGEYIYNKEVYNLPIASVCAKGREFENSQRRTNPKHGGFTLPIPLRK